METPLAILAALKLHSNRRLDENIKVPSKYTLHQNHPNPFNPATTIRYDIPELSNVSIIIYDILGREVKTLVNNTTSAGFHELRWDGKDSFGVPVSTGMYIYRMAAVSVESERHFVQNHKMVMMK